MSLRHDIPRNLQTAARRAGLKLPDWYAGSRGGRLSASLTDVLLSTEKITADARSLARQIDCELQRGNGRAVTATIVRAWAAQAESVAERMERAVQHRNPS